MSKHKPFDEAQFKNTITAVIDGDGIAWAVGWNHKDDLFPDKALAEVDDFMHNTLQTVQARHYVGILSPAKYTGEVIEWKDGTIDPILSRPNFREAIAKSRPYKGNRKEKPEWYVQWEPVINAHLQDEWGFIRCPEGYEADDLCATLGKTINVQGNCTMVHTDKDINQCPGNHYNPVKKELYHVEFPEAIKCLFTQILTGDTTDNIPGLDKCGPVGAKVILEHEEVYLLHTVVLKAFTDKLGVDKGIQSFYENYMLCKLRDDMSLEAVDDEAIRGYDLDEYAKLWNSKPEAEEDTSSLFGG